MKTISLKISGMTCSGCVRSIEKALKKHEKIASVKVDLKSHSATIEADLEGVDIIELVKGLGFEASLNEAI